MRPTPCALILALWLAVGGCAGPPHRLPSEPRPVPAAPQPEVVLRERLPLGSGGEAVLDDRDGLSPDEAAIMAIDQNPRLRAIRAQRGIARAEIVAAGILPNPRLETAVDFPVSGEADVLGYGIGLAWNVSPLLPRSARTSAARENFVSVDLEVAWQEWQVAQAARLYAIRSICIERRVRLAREIEEAWQQRFTALRQALAGQAVTQIEVTTAERFFAEACVNRLELERQLVAERGLLNRALGISAAVDIILDDSCNVPGTMPPVEDLLAALPHRRLDLLALQHAHRSRDEAVRAEVIARFPTVEIGFRAGRGVDRIGSAGLTLSFEIPFFDRNQHNVSRARAQLIEVEAEYDARLLEAQSDTLRTVKEIVLVQEQLAAAREASEAAGRLAELAGIAGVGGALNPLLAADILERYHTSRLRMLEIEQVLAELQIALAISSGVYR